MFALGQRCKTRYGLHVDLVRVDLKNETFPILGIVTERDGTEHSEKWTAAGYWEASGGADDRDLLDASHDYKYPKKYYKYLDNLRESGVTNMYGGGTYVAEQFDLTINKAREVLSDWMENFPLDYDKGVFPDE